MLETGDDRRVVLKGGSSAKVRVIRLSQERNGLATALRLTAQLMRARQSMPAPRLVPTIAWVNLIAIAVLELADSTTATMPLAGVMEVR